MMECESCGSSDVVMIQHNGVTDPSKTRIEWYRCNLCDQVSKLTLLGTDDAKAEIEEFNL